MKNLLLPFLLLVTICRSVLAQVSVSEPVGYISYTLPGAPPGGTLEFPLSYQLSQRVLHQTTVASVSGDTITLNAPYLGTTNGIFLTVQNGLYAGLSLKILASASPNTFTTVTPPVGAISPDTLVRLRSYDTLDSAFPVGRFTDGRWLAHEDPALADNIILWNAANQTPAIHYLTPATSDHPARWQLAGQLGDAGATSIDFPASFLVVRRGPSAITLQNLGLVSVLNRRWQQIYPGLNLLGTPIGVATATPATLANCGLYTPGSPYSISAGLTPAESDSVTFYDNTLRLPSAWCSNASQPAVWLNTNTNSSLSAVPLPFEGSLLLYRYSDPTWVRLIYPAIPDYPDSGSAPASFGRAKLASERKTPIQIPLTISPAADGQMELCWSAQRGRAYVLESNHGSGWQTAARYRATKAKMVVKSPVSDRTFFRLIRK